MSTGRSETTDGDEKEQAEMLIRAMTEKNVKKIENALAKTKKHGKGFVLSSHFYKPKQRQQTQKDREKPVQPRMPIVIGSPIGTRRPSPTQRPSSPPRTKSADVRRPKLQEETSRPKSAYLTEYIPPPIKVDMAIQSNEPEDIDQPETPPASPEVPAENDVVDEPQEEEIPPPMETAVINEKEDLNPTPSDTERPAQREEPVGRERILPVRDEKRISYFLFKKLGLPKRPQQFQYKTTMPPTNYEKNPENPEPEHPYVYMTQVPINGGDVTTPFYMKVELPEGALRDDVIMKFETLSYKRSFLDLDNTEKLCSNVIDVNMTPSTYCLHQNATVRLRILEECINKFDDVTIVSARNLKWKRRPTKIESIQVNGSTHHYAVTQTQALGKFAVITTRKMDRFVMTTAGGQFASTSLPEVKVTVREGLLTKVNHLVEVSMEDTRVEALTKTAEGVHKVPGVEGELIASSPILSVTKEIMGKTGYLQNGDEFPGNVRVTVPVTSAVKKPNEKPHPWREPTIKIMRKTKNNGWNTNNKNDPTPEIWEDITAKSSTSLDHKLIEKGSGVPIETVVPCQLMVLVFDLGAWSSNNEETELSEVCNKLERFGSTYEVTIMVHRQINNPQVINVHVVPVSATKMIQEAILSEEEWEKVGETSTGVRLGERESVTINFQGNIKLAINQMEPEIIFHSRRWQGYQYQIEGTDEGYSSSIGEAVEGVIDFFDQRLKTIHTVNITLPHNKAKPYRPTVVEKPLPRVTVVREYKLKWLKSLSAAEKEKYKSINTP